MSQSAALPSYVDYQPPVTHTAPILGQTEYSRRTGHLLGACGFGLATVIAAMGWAGGGSTGLDNFAWIVMTLTVFVLLLRELVQFTQVFGLGKIIFYGGVLIWFGNDYFYNAFISHDWGGYYTPEQLSCATFYHCLFVGIAGLVVQTNGIGKIARLMTRLPEPKSHRAYLPVILMTSFCGLLPFMLYSKEPLLSALYHAMVNARSGNDAVLEVSRGNLNYSWDAYILRMLDLGIVGAIFGSYYGVFMTTNRTQKVICVLNWIFWALMSFGTGSRGWVIMMIVPTAAFFFLKYQTQAAFLFRRHSIRAYAWAIGILLLGFAIMQIQITYRNIGFQRVDLNEVKFLEPQGNLMYSESLRGFKRIPAEHDYFYNDFAGETLIAAPIVEIFYCVIHPIPRALWNSKPYDRVWAWFNAAGTGRSTSELEGTTLATGLVGHWYIRYGFFGVLEGAVIFGLLLSTIESAFRISNMKPLTVFLACGLLMTLFRLFRAFGYAEFWGMLIGLFIMWGLLQIFSLFLGGSGRENSYGETNPIA
jgi:hypothetical protein